MIKKFFTAALVGVILGLTMLVTTASAAESEPGDNPGAFTPAGSGTVIDNVMEKNGKEFYTITTESGSVFYLVVDRLREHDNVYFLNAVTEADLMALAEIAGAYINITPESGEGGGVQIPPGQQKPPGQEQSPGGGLDSNTTTLIFVGIGVVVVGGIGFYVKIIKGKKKRKDDEYDDYDEYDGNDNDDYGEDDTYDDSDNNANYNHSDDDTGEDDLEW